MAYAHRNGDSRACGAATVVTGQSIVKIDGQLWAVAGDPDSHGGGGLVSTHPRITINSKPVIVAGDAAAPDDLCPIEGGQHCAPSAVGFSPRVKVL